MADILSGDLVSLVAVEAPRYRQCHLVYLPPDAPTVADGTRTVCGKILDANYEVVRRRARYMCSRCRREASSG